MLSEKTHRRIRKLINACADAVADVAILGRVTRQNRLRRRYLDLMERCLAGVIYEDPPLPDLGKAEYDPQLREYGWDWPSVAHTMIGSRRLNNVRTLLEQVIVHRVPGDVIETGVWRGGACIMMRAVLEAYAVRNRRVWLADSFEGVPAPKPDLYPADANEKFHEYAALSVPIEQVRRNFSQYGLLDEQVVFLKGWFQDTLPTAPIERLALLRLDGDLYESTIVALRALYDKLSRGGYVIIDDYRVVPACKQAVDDFCAERRLAPEIIEIDGVGVYWRKT
ncbi:MAG TPA: TylF/MycF family methyltransferase [Burkholderiales bacterium]|nr:TylF/MycF family methyltransferase [Burkholderiales bacterium]